MFAERNEAEPWREWLRTTERDYEEVNEFNSKNMDKIYRISMMGHPIHPNFSVNSGNPVNPGNPRPQTSLLVWQIDESKDRNIRRQPKIRL